MTQTLFLDADVILDLLAQRPPWYANSADIFSRIQSGQFKGATSILVFANVFYILRKVKGNKAARESIKKLNSLLRIHTTSEATLEQALNSSFTDFEDALQYFTAQNNQASLVITRNIKDYKPDQVPVMTPEQFLYSLDCH